MMLPKDLLNDLETGTLTKEDLGFVEHKAGQISIATEAQMIQQMNQMAGMSAQMSGFYGQQLAQGMARSMDEQVRRQMEDSLHGQFRNWQPLPR